jgi:hypothetical protein
MIFLNQMKCLQLTLRNACSCSSKNLLLAVGKGDQSFSIFDKAQAIHIRQFESDKF